MSTTGMGFVIPECPSDMLLQEAALHIGDGWKVKAAIYGIFDRWPTYDKVKANDIEWSKRQFDSIARKLRRFRSKRSK